MSASAIVYLVAMAALFVGQRLLHGNDGPQTAVTVVGLVLLFGAAALRLRRLRRAEDPGLRLGHRVALVCLAVGAGALVLYAGTTDAVVAGLGLGDVAEERWLGVWRSLWPLIWLLGTAPMLVVDYACQSAPVMMPTRRVKELALHGLVGAMAVGLVFPVNYIASQHKERWDLAYFKTPQPGTATEALTQALEVPVDVRIFMPPSSEVAQELRAYFGPLEGPRLRVTVIDQAAEPRLAKALSVRDNGTIAFTQGEVVLEGEADPDAPKPITRTIKVSPEIDKAKRTLKKLDAEVQKVLIELGQGERVAYVTAGHKELTWREAAQPILTAQSKGLRAELQDLGFTVKELGLELAKGVPDDASMVVILGPLHPFRPAEVDAIRTYLHAGGSLLVAQEAKVSRAKLPVQVDDPLDALVAEDLGVTISEGVLADEVNHARVWGNKADNTFVLTGSFTSHGSSTTVAAERPVFGAMAAGHLQIAEGHEAAHTVTVRTMATAFVDENRSATYDADAGEEKGAKPLVVAVAGSTNAVGWRAVVFSSASMLSDMALGTGTSEGTVLPGNVLMLRDVANWLIGAEGLSGTTQSEEDVRIEHTKDGQTWWFYSTVLGVPLLVFGLGAVRVRLRQRGGRA